MNKNYLFSLLLLLLCSCSGSNTIEDEVSTSFIRSAGDTKFDVLGMGYDITDEYLHPLSVRNPVFDVEKYYAQYPARIVTGNPSWGGDKFFYGYDAVDYNKDITSKSNIKIEQTAKAEGLFAGNFSRNTELKSSYSYSSKYSFASVDAIRNRKYIRINDDDLSRLSGFLTNEFKEDLAKLSADRIVEKYGTHVLTDFSIGGRYRLLYRSVITKTTDSTTKTKTVGAGLNFTIKSIGFKVDADYTSIINESLTKDNTNRELFVLFAGGKGTAMRYDLEKGSPTSVDLATWEAQIGLDNASLTDITWTETHFIYEFISDPVKKAEIKAAVEKYIDSKKLQVMEIVPLHRWYSGNRGDHYYSIVENSQGNGYSYDGIECYVFKTQYPGTVPLHRWYNGSKGNHYYSITPNSQGTGFSYDGIECYVYSGSATFEQIVPLYRWYSGGRSDHYYSVTQGSQGSGYKYDHIECYVYPSN